MRIATSLILFACLILAIVSAPALAGTPESEEIELYFISPGDGDTVSSPVQVVFGLSGMGVAPAGVEKAGTGHHHLIIDAELPPLDKPIPSDANHRHFGGGQTETVIDLPPGKHTFQLVLGDFTHVPHAEPVVSRKITITVK